MALQRRVLLAVLTAGFLLCLYICVNLETPLTWPAQPHSRYHGDTPEEEDSFSQSSEDLKDVQTNENPWPPQDPTQGLPAQQENKPSLKTEKPPPAENESPDESKSKSGSEGGDQTWTGTRTSTRGPVLKPLTQVPRSTEPPYIGDVYMKEDISQQTTCPDGLRTRVSDSEFADRFLTDVPVLQSSRHLSPEQYQRLSQYPGAHGWGSVDYEILEESLSLLNLSANSQMFDDWSDRRNRSDCIRCAVVGNGGILNNSRKGHEIDGHDYVFRTNGAVIKGFEQDVGSRTTHYLFSTNTMMNSMRSYAGAGYRGPPVSQETRYVFLPDHDRDYLLLKAAATHTKVDRGLDKDKDPTKYFGEDVSVKQLKILHPDFVRYIRNRFLRSNTLKTRYKDIYRSSTGAAMLLAALHTCDQVSAYGFMTPDYRSYSDHYYDRVFHEVGFYANHDLRLEMSLWQQLHQDQLLRLYMRLQNQQGDRK